jgi:N-acetylglucosamine kinase-like BadF-type ATPase
LIAGVDAGQTGVRAALEDRAPGPVVPGVPRMEGGVTADEVADALLAALAAVVGDNGADAVGVGMSGFELASPADLERIAGRLREVAGAKAEVALASDGVTSLLGALGGPSRRGVVVAAGTGVVVLAHDGVDGWARVDGWGALLGDDGAGFAVGRAGLRAAMRSADGREDGSRALRAAAQERWGPIDALPVAILRQTAPVARVVASFAPDVAVAARAGDAVAAAMWSRAGDDLAASVAGACRRLFAGGEAVDVARLGNLWDAGDLLDAPFRAGLVARWPAARIVAAAGTALDGALALARPGAPGPVDGLLWRT